VDVNKNIFDKIEKKPSSYHLNMPSPFLNHYSKVIVDREQKKEVVVNKNQKSLENDVEKN
jgi:hypothetical protein